MFFTRSRIYYGWVVTLASAFIVFGVSGSQFSFGVFLKPMSEEFGWSRATLATAFGTTFILTGLLRPVAGYLADRYSPKAVALSGVALMAGMLFLLSQIENLIHLYLVFAVMSIGLTLAAGPTLTKVVSAWFYRRRGVTLGLVNGGGAIGGLVLVPSASLILVLASWREAYQFLGLLLLFLVLPLGFLLIKDRPEDMGLQPQGKPGNRESSHGTIVSYVGEYEVRDSTFSEAMRTPFFWKLTVGYFV